MQRHTHLHTCKNCSKDTIDLLLALGKSHLAKCNSNMIYCIYIQHLTQALKSRQNSTLCMPSSGWVAFYNWLRLPFNKYSKSTLGVEINANPVEEPGAFPCRQREQQLRWSASHCCRWSTNQVLPSGSISFHIFRVIVFSAGWFYTGSPSAWQGERGGLS